MSELDQVESIIFYLLKNVDKDLPEDISQTLLQAALDKIQRHLEKT